MGFPYDTADWAAATDVIFMGWGSSAPGIYSIIGIGLCVGALIVGQIGESSKYASHL